MKCTAWVAMLRNNLYVVHRRLTMVPEAGTGKSTPEGHTLSRPESPNAHTPPEGRRERYFNI